MLTFKSTGKPAKIYHTTPDTKYMPAKMMYGENMATGYDMITETGETVTLLGDYNKGLVSLQINGKSTQDGTPTPDNPVEVESVGALTTKNLLHSSATISTMSGVTMTYDNGVITLNGTCTASANFELCNIALSANTYTLSANANKVPVNNDYAFVQLYDSTNNQIIQVLNSNAQGYRTITTSVDGNFKYRVRIDVGCVYDNVILRPQLELGSTATEYEPYHKYKIPVVTKGKNLLPYPYVNTTRTVNGITFTDNGDGSITANGTATAAAAFTLVGNALWSGDMPFSAGTYTLSGCPSGGGGTSYRITAYGRLSEDANRKLYLYCYGDAVSKTIEACRLNIAITISKGITVSNLVFKPQLELGTTATEYEPYIPPVTTNIYLDEPLRGIESYKDYIEVRNGAVKKYQNIGTATENVTDAKPNSEYLGTMTLDGTADESGSITVQDGETVYYILSTPIVTDITNTAAGQELLSINTENGKTKTLTVTGTDMTVEQCKLNTQEV